MIDTKTLETEIQGYNETCRRTNHRPTYKGLATLIGISDTTISNVIHGHFNGNEYTNTPHKTRCIKNADFEIIRSIFTKEEQTI